MAKASRTKGLTGEREVRAIWEAHGLTVRGLEAEGDHIVLAPGYPSVRARSTIHSEVKRCESARPWAWMAQAEREAPDGIVPVVSFRRSRSPWYSIIRTDDLARLLA